MKLALANKGLIVDYAKLKKAIGVKKTKKLLSQLTLTYKFYIKRDRPQIITSKIYKFVTVSKSDGGVRKLLTLPRFFKDWIDDDIMPSYKIKHVIPSELKTIDPNKFLTEAGEPGIKFEGDFIYQQFIHDYLIQYIFQPNNQRNLYNRGCTFVMETGRGKTFLGGGLIRTLGVKTLIIAHNRNGLREWTNMLKCYPEIDIGYYYTDKKKDGDVVIMLINSAMRTNFLFKKGRGKNAKTTTISRDRYFRQFGFVIYDEVPDYVAEKRRKVFWETNFKYCLGLTATPDEHLRELDLVYKMHLGDLVYADEIPGVNFEDVEWDFTVQAIRYSGPPEYTNQKTSDVTELTVSAWMDKQFAEDPYRNQLVLDRIKEQYDAGRYIFVFAGVREILDKLEILIKDHLDIDPLVRTNDKDKIKGIKGGVSPEDVERAIEKSRIILTTYQYGSKGLSILKMDCGIAYTPRRNGMRQVTGRLTRMGGDISIPRVWIDIIDEETSMRRQYWDSGKPCRKKAYLEKGFTINEEDISYEDIQLDS